jgi:hypothetical protein
MKKNIFIFFKTTHKKNTMVEVVLAFLLEEDGFLSDVYQDFAKTGKFGFVIHCKPSEEEPEEKAPTWWDMYKIKQQEKNELNAQFALFAAANKSYPKFQCLIVCAGDMLPVRKPSDIHENYLDPHGRRSNKSFIAFEIQDDQVVQAHPFNSYVRDQSTALFLMGFLKDSFNVNKSIVDVFEDGDQVESTSLAFGTFLLDLPETTLFVRHVKMHREVFVPLLEDNAISIKQDKWPDRPPPIFPRVIVDIASDDPAVKIPFLEHWTQDHVHFEEQTEAYCGMHAFDHIMQTGKIKWETKVKTETYSEAPSTTRRRRFEEGGDPTALYTVINASAICKKGVVPDEVQRMWIKKWIEIEKTLQKPFTDLQFFSDCVEWKQNFTIIMGRKPTLNDMQTGLGMDIITGAQKTIKEDFDQEFGKAIMCNESGNLPVNVLIHIARMLKFQTVLLVTQAEYIQRNSDELLAAPQCLGVLCLFNSQKHWIAAVKYDKETPRNHIRIYDSQIGASPPEKIEDYFHNNNYGQDEIARLFIFAEKESFKCPAVEKWEALHEKPSRVKYDQV